MEHIQKTDFYSEHYTEATTSGLLIEVGHISTHRGKRHTQF